MSSQVPFAYILILILWCKNVSLPHQQQYSWGFWAICWTIPLFSSLTSDLFNVNESLLLLGGWINSMRDVKSTNNRHGVECSPLMWAADSLCVGSVGWHPSYEQSGPSFKFSIRKKQCYVCKGSVFLVLQLCQRRRSNSHWAYTFMELWGIKMLQCLR